MRVIEVGKKYRHFKNKLYEVLLIAYDANSEPLKQVVDYKSLYGDNQIWTRDYEDFASKLDKTKYPDAKQEYRFELVDE